MTTTLTPSKTRSRAIRLAKALPVVTILAETAIGASWDLARIGIVRDTLVHLGYPVYFLTLLGVGKVAALAAILTPGHPRTREWAYAGLFFIYAGAAISHLTVGDGPDRWTMPMVFAACTLAARAWLPVR
ncbi:DoxX family protein [Nocardia sp. NPDC003482]|uniref:DoxX family protein n=1 Tax=Nocardia sp. NPDC004068 TaxID=3364303 RepID=UPI0036C98DD3